MPCIVRNLSDDQAVIVMVDSNLQREEILPSEKAFAYKMKLEAMKRQAGRPRKNSVPVAQEFRGKTSREILGEQVGDKPPTPWCRTISPVPLSANKTILLPDA